jgi:hypothetical protein
MENLQPPHARYGRMDQSGKHPDLVRQPRPPADRGANIPGDRAYPIDPGQRRPDDDWTDAPAARWDLITAVPAPRAIGPQE